MLARPAETGAWLILVIGLAAGLRALTRLRREDDHARAIPHAERWRRDEELYARTAAVAAPARALTTS